MTPDRWAQISQVYELVDCERPADRPAMMDRLCEGDAELRAAIEALLATDEADADPLRLAIGEQAADYVEVVDQISAIQPLQRIGRYEIVRRVGQGGMGAVFEAIRTDDFHKRVALKIIRRELDSEGIRQRFEQERQLLANLDHPFIARLLDGGETPDGSPYLVLEYVDGEPFLEHCARLDRTVALRVFLKVCEAVEHAHRNLVIHRDLKPSNILVNAAGEPRLLDFGIAKLIAPDVLKTETALGAMTLAFASPEQLLGRPMGTASDVYSLGVILYRMLTGRMPHDLDGASPAQIERLICEAPPATPGLDGDLDAIMLMALRKEPERRYSGVWQLAEDIERHLGHLPVLAKPDTFSYRVRKFVRRRWPALVAATAVLAAVSVGTTATLYQARVAQDRFDQVRHLAHSFVFDYADDLAKIEGSTAVRERMVRTALDYLGGLSRQAGGDVRLQAELAAAYKKIGDTQGYPARPNLGHVDQAVASYGEAARLYERVVARDPKMAGEVGAFYTDYARLLGLAGDAAGSARATASAFRNLALAERYGPADAANQSALSQAWCVLGEFDPLAASQSAEYHNCYRFADAVYQAQPTWENRRREIGALIRDGDGMIGVGRFADAFRILSQVEQQLSEGLAAHPHDPELRKRQTMLAQLYSKAYYNDIAPSLNDSHRSAGYSEQYLQLTRQRVARDPRDASSRFSLAVALFRLSFPLKFKDPAAAVASARESVGLFETMMAEGEHDALVVSRHDRAERRLSEALLFEGKISEAADWSAKALADERRSAAAAPNDTDEISNLVMALINAGRVADARHDRAAAEARLVEAEHAAAALRTKYPTDLPSLVLQVRARQELAEHARQWGDHAAAVKWAEAARGQWRGFPDQNAYVRAMAAGGALLPR
jgi:hypothetical protein